MQPRKLTCPLKRDYFSREYIFQPLIFRGHVSFEGSALYKHMSNLLVMVTHRDLWGCSNRRSETASGSTEEWKYKGRLVASFGSASWMPTVEV